MIPLLLITGFLGSGKTTLLRRIARENTGHKLVFLINEFSTTDVDGQRLLEESRDSLAIPGGSIFCECLVTEFIRELAELPGRFDHENAPFEGVIIEASGIADPASAGRMLRETGLDKIYRLARIVTIVDPGTFSKLVDGLPNIASQVESAGLALLNKSDLYPEETLRQIEDRLRELNPTIQIQRTVHCNADLDLFAEGRAISGAAYAKCRDPRFQQITVAIPPDMAPNRLCLMLDKILQQLYRAKGFFEHAGKIFYLDAGPGHLEIEEAPSAETLNQLVLIFPTDSMDTITAWARELRRNG